MCVVIFVCYYCSEHKGHLIAHYLVNLGERLAKYVAEWLAMLQLQLRKTEVTTRLVGQGWATRVFTNEI